VARTFLVIYSTLMIFLCGAVVTILVLVLLLLGILFGISAQNRAVKKIDDRVKSIEKATEKTASP